MNVTLSDIIWLIVALVGLALLVDAVRRRKNGDTTQKSSEAMTADQMEPTLTGRFRVQQMLDVTQQTENKKSSRPAAREGVVAHDEDAEALPDPFKPKK